jgi:hypothetical protein
MPTPSSGDDLQAFITDLVDLLLPDADDAQKQFAVKLLMLILMIHMLSA